jgi:hypothetical protein
VPSNLVCHKSVKSLNIISVGSIVLNGLYAENNGINLHPATGADRVPADVANQNTGRSLDLMP